ncbi:hypothetical protein Pint_05637 [Pistacia integerrima]|uniref:Uncharacterized protein n=1 Tax=Pistacia integerrima TaxID=434235 RepID=A0ACC0Z542_9ROSI|nr:hypothetical protein Pint_05637 [Pistacia integerrima]
MSSNFSQWWTLKRLFCSFVFLFINADCGQIVRKLPGFSGTLPFSLETGYISVGSSELFYLFVKSQGNPEVDPLLYYIVGGPGCPLQFDETGYTGGLPTLHLYPHTWTKSASIIFVDAPIGSGYSYSTNPADYEISDLQSANQSYIFIREWLNEHPQFIKNPFFVATDSYSGVLAPIIANNVLDGNNAGLVPTIILVGIVSGSPRMNGKEEQSYQTILAHKLGLISKTIFNYAKEYCNGTYFYTDTSTVSAECLEYLEVIDELIEQINTEMVLAPKCSTVSPKLDDGNKRRSLRQTDYWCKGTIREWRRCNLTFSGGSYDYDVDSSFDYHKNLTKLGLQLLLYSGDHDLVVPHIYTEYWMGLLDITLDEDWRPWFVGGQTVGYTLKYSNYGYRLTYATLKGSGHSSTEWKGRETYEMFERWVHFYPL